MKTYEIKLHRTESITVKLEADGPQNAIEIARTLHSDFRTDACVELDAEGEPVTEHVILAACELCNRLIFNAEDYDNGSIYDGTFCCESCAKAAFNKSGEYLA